MKRSLIFGLIAVVSAGLLLAGCSQATDSDTTYLDKYGIYGTIEADILQARIDEAIATGGVIVLADGLTIEDTNASVVDFKTARVQVNGEVSAQGITINAVDAAVTWLDDDAAFTTTSGRYLYRNAEDILNSANGSRISVNTGAQFVNRLQDIIETATAAAVRNFTFGSTADFDYSTGAGIAARVNATQLANLYVLGTLTVPMDGVAPSNLTAINALGTVDVTGNNDVVLKSDKVVMTDPATLTSSVVGGAVITLADTTTTLPNVTVEAGKDITVKIGTPGSFAVTGKLNGAGTLKVSAAVTSIAIGGGNGNAAFTDTATGISTSDAIFIGNTGTTTFEGAVVLNEDTNPSYILGNAVFKGGFTRTNGVVYFGGDVTLYNGGVITLTTDDTVTLAAGKKIIVGGGAIGGGTGETVPLTPVLEAVTETLLTPATGALLTAPDAYASTATDDDKAAAKSIKLSTAALNISRGTLRVSAGGILLIEEVTLSTYGVAPGTTGTLSLADGATVSLSGSNSSIIDFGTVADEAQITGDDSSVTSLTASGAAAALGDDTISGAGATLALSIATGGTAGTDDPVIAPADNKNLTLDGVVLDLSAAGKVSLPATGSLTLVNQGTLFLVEGGFANDFGFIKYSTDKFGVLGGGERTALGAVEQTDGTTAVNLNSLAHRSGGGVTVQPGGAELVFIKGANVPQLSKTDS